MRFATIAAVAFSVVAGVNAYPKNGTEFVTTEIVTKYTTYCPYPTTVVQNNQTYTVTKATTLTITNCPCTVTKTYTSVSSTPAAPTKTPVKPSGTGSGPVHSVPSAPVYPNGTVPSPTGKAPNATKPAPSSTPSSPPFPGAANRATVAAGTLAGLIGVAAYLL